MSRRLAAWIRRFPYTSLLVLAVVAGLAVWGAATVWGVRHPAATVGLEFSAGMIVGGGWIARFGGK